MLLINILLGLIGLGVVVFIHELGHFLAARLVKIEVEAFSIGWGKPILKKKIKNVEYRLGMFPAGGYCKMKGDSDYNVVWENRKKGIDPEPDSYHAATPLARGIVCFAGPLFNFIFAILLLSILWGFGFEINTLENKIVLYSELTPGQTYPADDAGLQTGDRIIGINGREISYAHEIQETTSLNPNTPMDLTIDRNGQIITTSVTPYLDRSSGAGRIGISFWAYPVIGSIVHGSAAERAGLMQGDLITKVNGISVQNNIDFLLIREQRPPEFIVEYERAGSRRETSFTPADIEGELGFSWAVINYHTPRLSVPAAIVKGVEEGYKTFAASIKSLRLLFMGIDLTQAVSGPVRITYMIGDIATQGFGQGLGIGLRSTMEFLALISIALCVMNLLPLPIIDGGMIILFIVEGVRKKPLHPKAIAVFQGIGIAIICGLLLIAVFGDIMFFIRN